MTISVAQLTDGQKQVVRRLAKETIGNLPAPVAIYARMALALSEERGLRLTADECYSVLVMDDAPGRALAEAIIREEER